MIIFVPKRVFYHSTFSKIKGMAKTPFPFIPRRSASFTQNICGVLGLRHAMSTLKKHLPLYM